MARWAHVLWHNHNLRFEDFYSMDERLRTLYIASEIVHSEEMKKAKENAKAKRRH